MSRKSQRQDKQENATHNPVQPDADPSQPDPGAEGSTQEDRPEVGELKSQLEEAQAKAAETWDKLLRVTAEFENFKKRTAKERSESLRYATVPLLHSLLTVLDNFEMAMAAAESGGQDNVESLKKGVAMIFDQFKGALTEAGLEPIDAQGQPFDPNLHEAVSQQESDEVSEGHVLHQLRKGYKLHDRLLRPASVVVATSPSGQSGNDPAPPQSNARSDSNE